MKKLLTNLCLVLLFSYSTEVFSSQPNQEDCDILCQLGLSESTQTQIKEPQTKKTKTPTEDLPEFQYKVPSHLLIKNGGMTFEQGFRDPFTGVSIKYHENGQPEEKIYYKNGREVSTTKLSYNKNDQLEELGNYKNGVEVKKTTFGYHDNGQLDYKYSEKEGELDGLYEIFYLNGQPMSKFNYREGKAQFSEHYDKNNRPITNGTLVRYHENGQLYGSIKVKNGWWDQVEWYHENGQLQSRGGFKKGEQDGLWRYYDQDGKERSWSPSCYESGKSVDCEN